jgi:hypothetical protein
MATQLKDSPIDIQRQSVGANGGKFVTSTTAQTGEFSALICMGTTVIATVTGIDNATGCAGISLPSGFTIPGRITGFTLTSGAVLALYA